MLINFINSAKNIYNTQNIARGFNISRSSMPSFKGDSFERSSVNKAEGAERANSAENIWNEARIQKLYDEVYEDALDLISITKDLNIEKPKSIFSYDTSMSARMNYCFTSNELIFNMNKLKGDYYFCFLKDQNDNMYAYCGIHNKRQIEKDIERIKLAHPGYKFTGIKLTDIEKEAFVKSSIAHEIRHGVQCHLAASTKGCSGKHKAFLTKIFEQTKKPDEDYSTIEYLDNFVPKKLIFEDEKLKYSLLPDDNRYLSTKNHILDYTIKLAYNINDKSLYNSSPMEADANNYACEYFKILKNKPQYSEIRPFMADYISGMLSREAKSKLAAMEKYGFPKLSEKNE